jgi:CDP-glycerol glycerophosphotransferase (TagB/SpsB family)
MDVSPVAARGALKVNLWHGVPLKKIERDIEQPHHPIHQARSGSVFWRVANRTLRPQLTERYDCVLATSAATAERFGSAFGVEPAQIITAGYPRTDPLLSGAGDGGTARFLTREERAIRDELVAHRRAGRRVLLYMPTFRDWNNAADRRIPLDWESLDATLAARGGVLYCKLHPSDRSGLPALDHLTRIRVLPSTVDVYPLLGHTDALVSDYSSVFFDYLLLDRPLLFYAYDLEEYQRLSRTLYDRYDAVTPGPRARTPQELERLVSELLGDYDAAAAEFRAERARVRARFFEHADDRSSERLLDELLHRVAA